MDLVWQLESLKNKQTSLIIPVFMKKISVHNEKLEQIWAFLL